jgi:tetratricopeptide (TPR) repeat protein
MTEVERALAQEKEPEKEPQLQKRDQAKPERQAKPQTPGEEQMPPEEDDALKPKEYTFNPLQAEKELRVGIFYFHKGSYKAAAIRFREATRWNNNLAEAFLRLGESEEKEKDWKAAREAYEKYLQLAGDDKRTPEIRKKVGKLAKKS